MKKIFLHFFLLFMIFSLGSVTELSADQKTQISRFSRVFSTDFNKNSIDISSIVSGGPGKDGIPALFDPEFQSLEMSFISEQVDGALVTIGNVRKYYPYNILVWHEIVNDRIADTDISVTFCPLCGSAVVYDRELEGITLDFKVSGLLYDSNMIMFDTETESFWLQSTGTGVAGDYNKKQLKRINFSQMKLSDVKKKYPDTQIMTTSTGYNRNYNYYPYGGYNDSDNLYFPVAEFDRKYHPKELFYIIPQSKKSIALNISSIRKREKAEFEIKRIKYFASYIDGELVVKDSMGVKIPGYYEMWFSWAVRHKKNGIIWDPE